MMDMYWNDHVEIQELKGKVLLRVENLNDEIRFFTTDKEEYLMYHDQDCCESVYVEDINGDLDDLIGSPITMAEVQTEEKESEDGSGTWTFYRFATNKGYVTIRWLGESNGYYSESVSFAKMNKKEE
jgi:hypothetical protein